VKASKESGFEGAGVRKEIFGAGGFGLRDAEVATCTRNILSQRLLLRDRRRPVRMRPPLMRSVVRELLRLQRQ